MKSVLGKVAFLVKLFSFWPSFLLWLVPTIVVLDQLDWLKCNRKAIYNWGNFSQKQSIVTIAFLKLLRLLLWILLFFNKKREKEKQRKRELQSLLKATTGCSGWKITKVKGWSLETLHFLHRVGKSKMRMRSSSFFAILYINTWILKILQHFKRILALPTWDKKCTVSELQPFTFVISQMKHPVRRRTNFVVVM